jgi:outer membrane protein insertion porin family
MNFEMIFPLIPSIGLNGVGFYDMGNAYDDSDNIGFDTMRKAVGWGVRWRSPLAPIRIEVGYPLDKEEGEKSMVTNFSFGAPL